MKSFLQIFIIFVFAAQIHFPQWNNQNFGGGLDVFFIDDNMGWISYGGPIQFVDENTGWILGGGGLKKTTNAGNDWIYKTGASGKITKTIDGGENWFGLTVGTTETLTDLCFSDLNIGYTVGQNGIILKTTDGGTNWFIIHSDSSYDLYSVDFVNSLVGYAVGGRDSSVFLKTIDGGLSWTKKTIVILFTDARIINCVEFINPDVGWIGYGTAFYHAEIGKTTDGGETWDTWGYSCPISRGDTIFHHDQEENTLTDRQVGIRSIYFKDSNNGYAVGGTIDGWNRCIFITTNAGSSWQTKYSYTEQTGLFSVFVTNAGKGWALGYYGVVYITEDNGFSWSQILSGSQLPNGYTGDWIYSVFMINDTLGWACGSRKGVSRYPLILKTTNGGKIWRTNYETTKYGVYKECSYIFFKNENVGWAFLSANEGYCYKTTNGGSSWFNSSLYCNNLFFLNQDLGWATIEPGIIAGVLRSTNGGNSWEQKSSVGSYGVYFSDINNGWVVGSAGTILKSTDGGDNWIPKTSGTTSDLYSVSFFDNNFGMCTGGSGVNLFSTDGGESWIPKNGPRLYSPTFTSPSGIWGVSAGGTVYKSMNFGDTWHTLNVGVGGGTPYFLNETSGWVCSNNNIFKYSAEPIPLPEWTSAILVKDAGGTESSEILTFGQHKNATDNIDILLGEYELPPLPPTGIFDARFNLPTDPVVNSLKDFRDSAKTEIIWAITFQPGSAGYPMSFSWDGTSFPEGTFYLKDRINGTYVFVNMKNQSSYTLTNPVITSLNISYKGIFSSVLVNNEWNMISVPLLAEDMSLSNLFPTATSLAYGFDYSYVTEDTLVGGKGYWLKFDGNQQIQIFGSRMGDTVPLETGWNMFGVYEEDIPISQITTTPPGIIATYFFGFNNGYEIADTLKSGQGYWVRVTQDAVLNFNSGGLIKDGEQKQFVEIDKDWGKIKITDNKGKSITLYAIEDETDLSRFELPPIPLTGIFDTRYSSGRLVENLSSEKTIQISSDNYPITISAEGLDLTVRDLINGELLNEELKNGEELRITNNKITSIEVSGRITGGLPISYELYQNYPNPFNPSTIIKFAVPKESNVNLSIYNVLGELISTIVNEEMKAGYYEYQFDASNLASGVYLFRIKAGDPSASSGQVYIETKKMILLK